MPQSACCSPSRAQAGSRPGDVAVVHAVVHNFVDGMRAAEGPREVLGRHAGAQVGAHGQLVGPQVVVGVPVGGG